MDSKITYLIDKTGAINHTWSSDYLPGVGVRWLGDGTILRTIRVGVGPGSGGAGGGVQKVAWDGTVVWDFRYNTNGHLSHHDVRLLPNGNVLLIAWETKTPAEVIAAGRNLNYVTSKGLYPDHVIEVQPTGSTSGTIVWEWHVWDHLIQDYDSSKANYGVVGDHPELVDINYWDLIKEDLMHTNSVDYNEEFDQILISVHNFNEIWVIDHSTTTAEAASHTGGNSGKGGDLLYRWGNPAAYRAGTTSDQKLFNQHDASWIDKGFPGEGNILVFNNGAGRPDGLYSSVDEIVPPVNQHGEYYRTSSSAYGPAAQTWRYTANPPTSFFSGGISGAERLTNGNTLICSGEPGVFFEVTSTGSTVWTYTNPYPAAGANNVFKIVYIPSREELPNNPPEIPENPRPSNQATDVDIDLVLSWIGGDPDSGDVVVYDVFFGSTSPLEQVAHHVLSNSYDPGTLAYDMTYFWQVVAWDNHGLPTEGFEWSFTTTDGSNSPPNTPSTPNGATTGLTGVQYQYTTSATDPDPGDHIRYGWDLDDDGIVDPGQWTGYYTSGATCIQGVTFPSPGHYNIRAIAEDNHGAQSIVSPMLTVSISQGTNNPPTVSITSPSSGAAVSGSITIQGTASDSDGTVRQVEVCIDSGSWWIVSDTNSWTTGWDTTTVREGSHTISARSTDNNEAYSTFTSVLVTVSNMGNNPPHKPCILSGEVNGKVNVEYTYTTSTTDANGDQVYYNWSWGDGTYSGWLGPYASGANVSTQHIWSAKESYQIKVKAKDSYGKESDWSDPLLVTMPYTYRPLWQFWESLFARFPDAFPILQQLLGY